MNRSSTTPRSLTSDQLRAALGGIGGQGRPDYLADIVAQAGRTRQRPAWTFLERWLPMGVATQRQAGTRSTVVFATLFLLVALLVAGVVYIGYQRIQREPIHVTNGLIAFAADASAGDALTDPVDFVTVETRPQPMDIYLTGAGGPTRRLIATDAHERCPVFSPDGQRLAYLEVPPNAASDGPFEAPTVDGSVAPSIVVVRLNAAGVPSAPEMRVLLPASAGYRVKLDIGVPCPQWSPDGGHIAYLAYRADAAELRVSSLGGRESVLTSNVGGDVHRAPFAWAPDRDAIAYVHERLVRDGRAIPLTADGVSIAALGGRAPIFIWRPDNVGTFAEPDGRPTSVSWSSRGELAVTVVTDVAGDGGRREVSTLHVVDVDTGSERSLAMVHTYDYAGAWSPDGSRLAFVGENGHILLSDRRDGSTTTLSPRDDEGQEFHFWDVAWSPDGQRLLALARADDVGFALVSLSTDGESADVLTPWTYAMDWINLADVSWQPVTTYVDR